MTVIATGGHCGVGGWRQLYPHCSQENAGPLPSFLAPPWGAWRSQGWGRSQENAGPLPSFLAPPWGAWRSQTLRRGACAAMAGNVSASTSGEPHFKYEDDLALWDALHGFGGRRCRNLPGDGPRNRCHVDRHPGPSAILRRLRRGEGAAHSSCFHPGSVVGVSSSICRRQRPAPRSSRKRR